MLYFKVMRIFDIILTKMALNKLRFEEKLEEVINSDISSKEKEEKIDEILEMIALESLKMKTWSEYMPKPKEDDDN